MGSVDVALDIWGYEPQLQVQCALCLLRWRRLLCRDSYQTIHAIKDELII